MERMEKTVEEEKMERSEENVDRGETMERGG